MSKSESLDFLNVKSLNKNRSTPSIDVFKSQEKPRNQRSTSSGLIANSNFDGSVLGKLERDNFNKSANSTRREYSMKRKPVKLDRIQSNRTSPSPDFSHSFMLQPKVVEAQDLYKSCISRSPYEQPAEKYSASEIISKEAAKNEFSKLNLRFEKMKKILNNQDFPTLGDMIAGVETAGKVFCDCDWILGSERMEAISLISHLSLMLNKSVTEVVSKQVKSSEIIDSLQKSNEFLLKESLKVRDLQNKLESATFKFQKLEKSKHDISNNVGQVRVADLEKEKLIEKINILEKYISDLKDVTKIDTISMDLEKYKDMYTKLAKEFQAYKKDKESKHYRMQLELGELRNSLKKISANIDHYDEDKKNYEQRFLDLSLKNRDLEERIKEFRERMAMLIEDSLRYLVFRDLYLKSEQQFNTMRLKYNQLELNIIAGNVTLSTDGVIWVSLDDPLFDLVRGFLSSPIETKIFDIPVRDRSRTRTEAPVYYPQRANSRTMTYSETQLDPSFVNLSQFTLKRPTYASLFEIDAKKTSYELPFTNWLEITMRGIYDSKYNEQLYCSFESGRTPAKFPEFVYSWIGRFTIDPGARQVRELEWWKRETSDKLRLDLLLALKHEKSKKVWEIHTFIEFLQEELMLDELAFFLHCRFLLFKGPQLMITTGRFSALHFVKLELVFDLIDKVMEKISPKDRTELKTQLQSKARNKNGTLTLDSALALRIILEYYIREKKCKYLVVKGLFYLAPRKPDGTLTYQTFRIICLNLDPEANESMILRLYRDVWAFGNGQMTHDNFFIFGNESGFFYHSLRLKGNDKPLPLNSYNEIDERASENSKYMRQTFNTYIHLKQPIALIREAFRSLGVIDLLDNFIRLEELIRQKYQEPLENYKGLNYLDTYKHMWNLGIQLQIVFEEIYCHNPATSVTDAIKDLEIISLPRACEGFIERLHKISLQKLTTIVAIRRIQRNWKDRAKKNLNVATTVFKGIAIMKRAIKNHDKN